MDARSDVIVVGAGIVGLGHALSALERGLSVTVLERDARAVGASVRNFGHACVTAQTGDLLDLALVARERWLRLAARAGLSARETGGVAVARSAAELAVLDELAAERGDAVRMLDAAETRTAVAGEPEGVVGGAWLRDDLRVDPREAVGAIAAWLARQPGVRFLWRTSYLGGEDGVVRTSRGELRADHVFVCVGHDLDLLFPDLADEYGIRRCALQMALVENPDARSIGPAVLTGTSMLRYPAFAETAASSTLRAELESRRPELLEIVANVMLTQRPDGSIVVGDSHAYDLTHPPFLDEPTSDLLLAEAARLLGVPRLDVRERWQGVYASSDRQPFVLARPDARTSVATVSSGVGMTIGLGLAERSIAQAEGSGADPSAASATEMPLGVTPG